MNALMAAVCIGIAVFAFHGDGFTADRSNKKLEDALQLLQHHKTQNRSKAIQVLAGMDDPRTVEPLISALADEVDSIRRSAAEALGEKKDPRAVNALVRALLADKDFLVREWSGKALGGIGGPAVEPLIKALREQPEDKSFEITSSLIRVGAHAVGPLIRELDNGDAKFRRQALYLLGELRDSRAVEFVIPMLQEKDFSVAKAAAEALGRLGDAQAAEPLLVFFEYGDQKKADAARDALLKIGKPATGRLLQALSHPTSLVRSFAADLLGRTKDTRAFEPLLALLSEDTENDVRNSAAVALGRLGDPRALEPLLSLLRDGSGAAEKVAVIEALGWLGDPRAIRWLMPLLGDPRRPIQESVQDTLSKMGKAAVLPLLEARQNPFLISQATCTLFRIGQPAADMLRAAGETSLAMLVGEELKLIAQQYAEIIELGIDCSEPVLIDALFKFGGKLMAEHFLNCGNQELSEGARNWAQKHGFAVAPGKNSGPVWKRGH
jgi:HEAT repeat protein